MSRTFWHYLRHLPPWIRASIVRSKFQIEYELPPEITLKIAETENEIEQALCLVHDAYVELDYMDPCESGMRFSKFHAHPNAVILVAKWLDDVIGTFTIIPDSALGLPSDSTWTLDGLRKNGKIIAEVSSLTIKKDFRMRRGRLLLPLCKLLYNVCNDYLKLDGVVASTTAEVEPFYTDILMFRQIDNAGAKPSQTVKSVAASTCGFLSFGSETVAACKKAFAHRPDKQNIYKFMREVSMSNIQLPQTSLSIQGYMHKKNLALSRLLDRHPSLVCEFSEYERRILKSYDLSKVLEKHFPSQVDFIHRQNRNQRPEVRLRGWCIPSQANAPVECRLIDLSLTGLRLGISQAKRPFTLGEKIAVVFEHGERLFQIQVEVRWISPNATLGCTITEAPKDWSAYIEMLLEEIHVDPVAIGATGRAA